jgi:hopanoid biosynthesis associated protein HpnK
MAGKAFAARFGTKVDRSAAGIEASVMREVIVSADDFGLAPAVNEAVERAHCEGILTTASLMMGAPATGDALERAARLPNLHVGLHVVLVNGTPVSPRERVPGLVDADGCFESDLLRAGIRYFFRPGIRAQLEREIEAQFAAFAATGLPLDHVNAQNHFHVHPTVLSLIMRVGKRYGARAIRVPREPFLPSWRAIGDAPLTRFANDYALRPWLGLMRARLKRHGFRTNDYVFGLNDSGKMTAPRVRALIAHLPPGISEIYFHPATCTWPGAEPPHYDFAGEFAALIDPRVAEALHASAARQTTYANLTARG